MFKAHSTKSRRIGKVSLICSTTHHAYMILLSIPKLKTLIQTLSITFMSVLPFMWSYYSSLTINSKGEIKCRCLPTKEKKLKLTSIELSFMAKQHPACQSTMPCEWQANSSRDEGWLPEIFFQWEAFSLPKNSVHVYRKSSMLWLNSKFRPHYQTYSKYLKNPVERDSLVTMRKFPEWRTYSVMENSVLFYQEKWCGSVKLHGASRTLFPFLSQKDSSKNLKETSLTQWLWVWVNSGSWWWTRRPGVLWFMGLQRVGHDWATELNWTEETCVQSFPYHSSSVFLLDTHLLSDKLLPSYM